MVDDCKIHPPEAPASDCVFTTTETVIDDDAKSKCTIVVGKIVAIASVEILDKHVVSLVAGAVHTNVLGLSRDEVALESAFLAIVAVTCSADVIDGIILVDKVCTNAVASSSGDAVDGGTEQDDERGNGSSGLHDAFPRRFEMWMLLQREKRNGL
jgi:hypothetical protein